MQLRNANTGLKLQTGNDITYAAAVAAITKLRDTLGQTSTNSVESPLTRTATPYTNAPTGPDQPLLFAVDVNAVAYTRTPKQVMSYVSHCFEPHVYPDIYCFKHIQFDAPAVNVLEDMKVCVFKVT